MSRTADATPTVRNRILAALAPDELHRLAPYLEPMHVPYGLVMYDVLRPIEHVWFPEGMIVSILGVMKDGSAVETATIGFEGASGIPIFLGDDRTTSQAFCQVPGAGVRLRADVFREELARGGTLRDAMRRFTLYFLTFAGQSSACNRVHTMPERCARWLLHTHDRTGRDEFQLTHQVLSQMLGVRRATVTEAMIDLQGRRAISYEMGRVAIRDRGALERSTCECYAIIQRELERLMGPGTGGTGGPSPLEAVRTADGEMTALGDGTPRDPAAP